MDSLSLRRLPLLIAALGIAACGRLSPPPPEVAAACDARSMPDPALARHIEPGGVDQWLFSEAVLHEVNDIRCDRGLAPLSYDEALTRAAAYHSGDMVTRDFLAHESPVTGRRTPRDRVAQVGADYSRIAENVARTSLYAFDGRDFYIRDQGDCDFSRTPEGPAIPRRTYAAAAERVVEGWMESRGHRRNILDPEVAHHGAGAAVRRDPAVCGELLVTQLFAG